MINVYPASSRHSGDLGWLQFNFSFSFADYYDPDNVNFGPLRVFNEDYIQPSRGFGIHPHRDMEIVTVVLKGELKHEDNTGGAGLIRPGEVQRMTAGSGILHSEVNASDTEVANLLQMWFLPEAKGLTPSYEQKAFDQGAMRNTLLPIVSNTIQGESIVSIHQDMSIYLSEPDAGTSIHYEGSASRKIFLFVMRGEVTLNGTHTLGRSDSARITDLAKLEIRSEQGAQFMLIDLPGIE
ncbi:pirin family protein [Paenibacillus sacheonensis]|uniref:Pirin family protein n=1 Tax=Paenibacillus sacheonensis TaxID=742054 RepID=A0A7X4YTB0_9BACL|nr:pirin family protein [Paenibacillus sacheonensis]MBM7568401.1 redox-sensitive bicupin YhaK (pirin superfamily) [Paenibacillus sacheonensis]NBC72100.1 pirin family protein [Paenibacillus sacheonensis]